MRPSTITISLVLALGLESAPLRAQPSTAATAALAGCYSVTRGPWNREFSDSTYHKMPETISLDTASTERDGRQLRPNMAYPFGRRFPGTPRWRIRGDTIELVWSDGFVPTIVKLVRSDDGTLRGRALALTDAHYDGEPPPPEMDVQARQTKCPAGFDESSTRAAVAVPPGLDSAASARWVTAQRNACRGQFLLLFDEVMTLNPRADSTPRLFQYARVLSGAQCLPKR
jgi:hypothetical protein